MNSATHLIPFSKLPNSIRTELESIVLHIHQQNRLNVKHLKGWLPAGQSQSPGAPRQVIQAEKATPATQLHLYIHIYIHIHMYEWSPGLSQWEVNRIPLTAPCSSQEGSVPLPSTKKG